MQKPNDTLWCKVQVMDSESNVVTINVFDKKYVELQWDKGHKAIIFNLQMQPPHKNASANEGSVAKLKRSVAPVCHSLTGISWK